MLNQCKFKNPFSKLKAIFGSDNTSDLIAFTKCMPRANVQTTDNEISWVKFPFYEKCNTTRIGGTNHTISDSIDIGGYVSRVFKVCQQCMNFLHESVIGNFENCSYFYFVGYIDPRS